MFVKDNKVERSGRNLTVCNITPALSALSVHANRHVGLLGRLVQRCHLYEVVSAEQRHGVGVLLLLLQQLSRQRLLMQQEALLLHDV